MRASTIALNWIIIETTIYYRDNFTIIYYVNARNNEEIIHLTLDTLEIFTRHDVNGNAFRNSDVFHHWGQQRSVNLSLVLITRSQSVTRVYHRDLTGWESYSLLSFSEILPHGTVFNTYKSEMLEIISEKNNHVANIQREIYIAINALERGFLVASFEMCDLDANSISPLEFC